MNRLIATDIQAANELRELRNQLVALAHEVKRIAVSLQLDEEALDRIIDNLPQLDATRTQTYVVDTKTRGER